MKRRLPLLILMMMPFAVLYGQKYYKPGYIVTNNFDTIQGYIRQQSNYEYSKSCDFMSREKADTRIYTPDQIRSYCITNYKLYQSRDVIIDDENTRVFLEYLVHGIVDLYYLKVSGREFYFLARDTLMVPLTNELSIITVNENAIGSQPDVKSYEKLSNQYKGVLRYVFQDSPDVVKKIENTPFDYKPLIKITKDYHNSVCKDYSCIDYTKSTTQRIIIEPSAGIINSWMGLKTSSEYAFNIKPYGGFLLRFKPFKGFSMWDLLTGLNISTNTFLGDYTHDLDSNWDVYRIQTDYIILRLPLMIERALNQKKLQPFVSAGVVNCFLLNPDYAVLYGPTFGNTLYTKFRTYNLGASLGFGLKYYIKSGSYLFFRNEFEYRQPVANFGYVLEKTYELSILSSVGLAIKFK